ncbi:MAG TPA: hypothetical protein VFB72_16640 [Verrucomicrobiae bacterium]|nr:hypothetical protein [Verrucomicrobiae bacterium]
MDNNAEKPDSVFVLLSVPRDLQGFPDLNIIGANLLMASARMALARDGIQINGSGQAGFLNKCLLLFRVSDSRRAAHCIHAHLEQVHLLTFASIWFFCEGEEVFRCIHSAQGYERRDIIGTDAFSQMVEAIGLVSTPN